jgi:hypothetical protein
MEVEIMILFLSFLLAKRDDLRCLVKSSFLGRWSDLLPVDNVHA